MNILEYMLLTSEFLIYTDDHSYKIGDNWKSIWKHAMLCCMDMDITTPAWHDTTHKHKSNSEKYIEIKVLCPTHVSDKHVQHVPDTKNDLSMQPRCHAISQSDIAVNCDI